MLKKPIRKKQTGSGITLGLPGFIDSWDLLCCRCLSCCFSRIRAFLTARTAGGLGLLGLFLTKKQLVEVNKLDHAHLGVVAKTVAGLEDACISARTVSDLLGITPKSSFTASLFWR